MIQPVELRVFFQRLNEPIESENIIIDYSQEIEPGDISYGDDFVQIGMAKIRVDNPRAYFAEALNCFDDDGDMFPEEGNCVVHSRTTAVGFCDSGYGTVIGGPGFGYVEVDGKHMRMPHLGSVRLGEGVSIGSNTCIDRGVNTDTVLGNFVKVDNLVHIAHGVDIGDNTLIAAGAVIGGSVKIGKNCFIGINASIKQKVKIGDNVTVGAGCVVLHDVPAGATIVGNPGRIIKQK